MLLWTWHRERTTLLLAWLSLLGVGVAVPIPWNTVEPIGSDASAPYGGDKHVCVVDDIMYRAGDSVAAASSCEKCVCRPPDVVCTTMLCEMKPGCRALQKSNQCCPEYQCECERDGKKYNNGEKLESPDNACEVCYCRGGVVVCTLITCYTRDDCQPQEDPGRCCPKYDHCPPLDSNNIKLTTTWPTSNISSPPGDSAPDVADNLVTTSVTASRRLSLPGEYRVTRVPVLTSSQDERHFSTLPSTAVAGTTSRVPDDVDVEDSVAESSEHSPVHINIRLHITTRRNETDADNETNHTLDNTVEYEDSAVEGSEIVSVTELGDATTSASDNSTTSSYDGDDRSMEATTEVPTTETYSVLATPGFLATSSRAPLTSEPWEEHRPTQMVTDDIQYVTTLNPLINVVDSSSTKATTSVSEEARDIASLEVTSETSSTTGKLTDDEIEPADSTEANEETSTVFDILLDDNHLNTTEVSESEFTNSSTQEPPEMITSMETLLDEMTSPVDIDEVVNDTLNTTLSETTTENVTLASEQADPFEQEDPLPVLKLSEEMAHHQMDFVIHHIIVPTESDDVEIEIVPQQPTSTAADATIVTEEGTTSSLPQGGEKEETSTMALDDEHIRISLIKVLEIEKKIMDDVLAMSSLSPTLEDVTTMDQTTAATAAATTSDPSGVQERIILDKEQVNKGGANVTDELEAPSTDIPTTARPNSATDLNDDIGKEVAMSTDELEATSTEIPPSPRPNSLPDVNDDLVKEVEASNVSSQTLDSLKVDAGHSTTEDTSHLVTEELASTVATSEVSDERFATDSPASTSTSDALEVVSSNIMEDEIMSMKTNDSLDEEDSVSNTTIFVGSQWDENSTLLTTGENENTTIFNTTLLEGTYQFQANMTREGDEGSSPSPSTTEVSADLISQDTSTTEEDSELQNATVIMITDDEPTEIIHTVTSSVLFSPGDDDDNSPRPDVKRETIFLTSLPPNEEKSAAIQSSNSENKFTALQRDDAEEIGKYDVALLQNFFKNLYIHDDQAIVEVT